MTITTNTETTLLEKTNNNKDSFVVVGSGTWDSATATLGYINASGATIALDGGAFTANFQKEVTLPGKKIVVTTAGGGGSLSLDIEASNA